MDKFDDEHPADMAVRMARGVDGRGGEMLRLYLGVDGDGRMTRKEIASRYGVPAERVRQVIARALDLVRLAMPLDLDGASVDDLIIAGHMRESRPDSCPRCLGSGRADATGIDVADRSEC